MQQKQVTASLDSLAGSSLLEKHTNATYFTERITYNSRYFDAYALMG